MDKDRRGGWREFHQILEVHDDASISTCSKNPSLETLLYHCDLQHDKEGFSDDLVFEANLASYVGYGLIVELA